MPSVAALFGLLEQLESSKIAVNQNRCVLVRNRNARCMRCAKACTSGCISFDAEEGIFVSPEKCIGCGTCATMCPTGALIPKDPDDSTFLRQMAQAAQANEGDAVVVCEQLLHQLSGSYDPAKVVSVPCLGRVDEGSCLALAAMGVEKVTLVHAECEGCPYAPGLTTARTVAETANGLLEVWASPTRVRVTGKPPISVRKEGGLGYDISKRSFLSDVKDTCKEAAAVAAGSALTSVQPASKRPASKEPKPTLYQKVQRDGTLAHHVPNRRKRLVAAVRRLGEPQDVMIDTRLWGHVMIDPDRCTSCRMCATFCPTGALAKAQSEEGAPRLEHAPSICVKCRTCEIICPAQALEISDEVFAVDMTQHVVERFPMKETNVTGNDQIYKAMKSLIDCDQFYESCR